MRRTTVFHRARCLRALSIAVGFGVGSIAVAQERAIDQAATVEAARLEVREVRRLADDLIGTLEAELMSRIKVADPELAASVQQSLMFQRKQIEWSWQAVEALPPQFMPALAAQARSWKPTLERLLPSMGAEFDLATQVRGEAANKRPLAPFQSIDACNAARSEDRICQVTPGADCFQADSLACIDFCGALLGFPVAFKALTGDEMEVAVAGFGFNFSSPLAIGAALGLHIAQILCNLGECAGDIVNECTRNEIRELIEQQHRHINDFDLDAATQEILQGLGANTGNALGSIESTRVLSAELDARLAEDREFIDDSELFAAEKDVSRDLFMLREQLCTLEALLYRSVSGQSEVPSSCTTALGDAPNPAQRAGDQMTRFVFSLMKEGRELPSLYLPESEGGLLEVVRALALDAARVGKKDAHESLAQAEHAMRQRRYRDAYRLYCQAVGGAS